MNKSDLQRIAIKEEKQKKKKTESQLFEKNKPHDVKKKNMTYKEKFNKKYNNGRDISNSKNQISKKSGIPIKIINEVYDRGIGAYKSNPSSVRLKKDFSKNPDMRKGLNLRLSKEQWAIARVYAFIMKTVNKREPQNQDLDLIKEAREILKNK